MALTSDSRSHRINHATTNHSLDSFPTHFEMKSTEPEPNSKQRLRSGLFSKPLLEETVYILPLIPPSTDIQEIKKFIRDNLRFSAEYSRARYTRYIAYRIFPSDYPNPEIRTYAKKFSGRQELKDVVFYRFLKSEPLMTQIITDLILPAIATGSIRRSVVKDYLNDKFPGMKSIKDCAMAVTDALKDTGLATTTQKIISFNYRRPHLSSFAYILHCEYSKPGIYSLNDLENNPHFKAMFWYPETILPSLYELRNQGIIARVSEIDTVRQFSTKLTLEEYVEQVSG